MSTNKQNELTDFLIIFLGGGGVKILDEPMFVVSFLLYHEIEFSLNQKFKKVMFSINFHFFSILKKKLLFRMFLS